MIGLAKRCWIVVEAIFCIDYGDMLLRPINSRRWLCTACPYLVESNYGYQMEAGSTAARSLRVRVRVLKLPTKSICLSIRGCASVIPSQEPLDLDADETCLDLTDS